jgi:hypothetical protein
MAKRMRWCVASLCGTNRHSRHLRRRHPTQPNDPLAQLERLGELRDRGLLPDDEFEIMTREKPSVRPASVRHLSLPSPACSYRGRTLRSSAASLANRRAVDQRLDSDQAGRLPVPAPPGRAAPGAEVPFPVRLKVRWGNGLAPVGETGEDHADLAAGFDEA